MPFSLLPWEYAVRNLFRRPARTALTVTGLTTVIVLTLVVIGFIRGLQGTLAVSGDEKTAVIFSLGMGENLEYSAIAQRTAALIGASVPGIESRYGQRYVSAELFLGTRLQTDEQYGAGEGDTALGLVRGVTPGVLRVRRDVQLESGHWPGPGEILVGRLVATKLDMADSALAIGATLRFEGRTWTISGTFSANGATFESEVWCRLDELQQALKRQDLSLVAVTLESQDAFADLDLFCKERSDLELQTMRERDYYKSLSQHYRPLRSLAWLVVLLVAGAGIFAGWNTMYAAVVGRTAELAMLQTLGFSRRAIVLSLLQEGLLLASGACLLAAFLALLFVDGRAVKITMGAFLLRIDGPTVLTACALAQLIGLVGTIPPIWRALKLPVVTGLKAH